MFANYLASTVERPGGFPGGGRGMRCAVMASPLVVGVTGRGILLFRKSGLEDEDSEGASSPWRSEWEPRSDSSSWERSEEAEEIWSRCIAATITRLSEDSDGEAEGEIGMWWTLLCSNFSLADPGGGSRKLDGSNTGIRLCRRLGSCLGAETGEIWPFLEGASSFPSSRVHWLGLMEHSMMGDSLLESFSFGGCSFPSLCESEGGVWQPFIRTGLRGEGGVRGDGTRFGTGLEGFRGPFPFSKASPSTLEVLMGWKATCSCGELMSALLSCGCISLLPFSISRLSSGTLSDADWEDSTEGRWAVSWERDRENEL